MCPTDNMTKEERACFPSSHVQITPSRSSGWVGGDREIREILDLLDVSAPSSVKWFFFPICPDFCFYLFVGVHAKKCNECAGDCACRISGVQSLTDLILGRIVPPRLSRTRWMFILYGIHVKWWSEGVRRWRWGNPVFVLVNACISIIQLYWITGGGLHLFHNSIDSIKVLNGAFGIYSAV